MDAVDVSAVEHDCLLVVVPVGRKSLKRSPGTQNKHTLETKHVPVCFFCFGGCFEVVFFVVVLLLVISFFVFVVVFGLFGCPTPVFCVCVYCLCLFFVLLLIYCFVCFYCFLTRRVFSPSFWGGGGVRKHTNNKTPTKTMQNTNKNKQNKNTNLQLYKTN